MAKRSLEQEMAEALGNMPRWRARMARTFLWQGVLIAFLGVVLVVAMWLTRHGIIAKFSSRPILSLLLLGFVVYALYVCVSVVRMAFSARRSLMDADHALAERETAVHPRREE